MSYRSDQLANGQILKSQGSIGEVRFYNRLGFEFDINSFDDCLLFFDEIQSCPGALSALKHLCIDGRCDIICSGSLLGNIVDNTGLLPLGYVETQYMNPMDFEEFLWANCVRQF